MAITKLTIAPFLAAAQDHLVLDVRSPGEYQHAHIPGAQLLALFTDEERKIVGTAYKQQSRQKAIKIGLQFFGPKMVGMIEQVEQWCAARNKEAERPTVLVHCWRGGMRSAGVAWLLDLYGFNVIILVGGYKTYRHWVLAQLENNYPIHIVGGYTGSGKTDLLHELTKQQEAVIDLEALALHKGSAFGALDKIPQPSQEMFENLLAHELQKHEQASRIWMEDESQRIGLVNIPIVLFKQMRTKPVFFLDVPFEERLNHIIKEYGGFEKEKLVNAIIRIKKRLGGLETKTAINYLLEDDVKECFRILLKYYDKLYIKGLYNRENAETLTCKIPVDQVDAEQNAGKLVNLLQTQHA
ncbi:MAG: tRNA 2-selenouridine(34) synthase MnmH [Sediminibacterium magnilacihabitans]|jgi:tRNA 2-selenouridine synthase|nr:tRNA 2-selenouridine(34) synthase MnmH [Sediminibacterium magnilacihabitans]PQV60150.1 tRNA 2-selenouridine synthase [Sediminibacterium magnilacihabitans]